MAEKTVMAVREKIATIINSGITINQDKKE